MGGFALTTLLLCLVGVPAVLSSLYLFVLTLLSRRVPSPLPATRQQRFDIVVPAHNEAAGIVRTITSLQALDWPSDRYRILVVADNCSDDTAAIARTTGATVLERQDQQLRGKGYALTAAFRRSRDDQTADAVVVVDADSLVSPNLLTALAARLERGEQAVQVHYGVLNPDDSWRTRLLSIALAAFHIVRSRARERLRVSCGIRGNGWCVTHALLGTVPYGAFSLAEDVEYGIALGLAGVRVAYADEACVSGEMVAGEQAARRQRQRWEHGRFQLIRSQSGPLLAGAVRQRSRICLDLGLDLLVLPLSFVALNVLALLALALLAGATYPALRPGLWVALACAAALSAYVLRGWQLSGIGPRGILDLLRAPFYVVWKILLMARPHGSEWVRTDRERR